MAIDPVCKMKVEESKAAATSEYKGKLVPVNILPQAGTPLEEASPFPQLTELSRCCMMRIAITETEYSASLVLWSERLAIH